MGRDFLKSLPADQRELGARVLDKAHLALKRYMAVWTDFLDPGQQNVCCDILGLIDGVDYDMFGGYDRAERKKIVIFPEDFYEGGIENDVCFLEITGNFRFQKVSHRDYLGAILGSGIKREKIGDLLVLDTGCQVIAAAEIKDYLINNLIKIHHVPITVQEISEDRLVIPPEKTKIISTTVPSLRLDAVAGAGYGLSRSKIAKYIAADKVKVNWEPKNASDFTVKEGDIISLRGFGRMKVDQVKGVTKKGRTSITITRYI